VTAPEIVARRIGNEQQPIAIVDGFHPDPEALRAAALAARYEPGRHHYPGIRAALPDGYFAAVRPALAPVLRAVFGHDGGIELLDASFSIVTTSPADLTPEQRVPHIDAVDPGRIALVHYLSDGDGTAFYRHRATGHETIDAARASAFLAARAAEPPPPPAYPYGDDAHFARIAAVEGRRNRAVIYRSILLHSGAIPPGAALPPDPATGRLTITAFLAAS
jgi:hypothetical protein